MYTPFSVKVLGVTDALALGAFEPVEIFDRLDFFFAGQLRDVVRRKMLGIIWLVGSFGLHAYTPLNSQFRQSLSRMTLTPLISTIFDSTCSNFTVSKCAPSSGSA